MKKMILAHCALALCLLPAVAGAPVKCPKDGTALSPTGRTKLGTVNGKAQMMKEYICGGSDHHSFWVTKE